MRVTRVTLKPALGRNLLAAGDVTIDGVLVIHSVRVYRKADGRLGVAMPSRPADATCVDCDRSISFNDRYCRHCGEPQPGREGRHYDVVHPILPEARNVIEAAVLHEYALLTAEQARERIECPSRPRAESLAPRFLYRPRNSVEAY